MAKPTGIRTLAQNRKARHDYFVEDVYECGMELKGTEVKSIRQGRISLKESYAVVRNMEVLAMSTHISPYEQGSYFNQDPMRPKRLLLHKAEIRKLQSLQQKQGYTLIPLEVYLKGSLVKMSLGVCVGKHLHDKRASMAEKDAKMKISQALKEHGRY